MYKKFNKKSKLIRISDEVVKRVGKTKIAESTKKAKMKFRNKNSHILKKLRIMNQNELWARDPKKKLQ